jgi:hypothetical protein
MWNRMEIDGTVGWVSFFGYGRTKDLKINLSHMFIHVRHVLRQWVAGGKIIRCMGWA